MKRLGNLYDQICSIDNLRLADEKARKRKLRSYGVQRHDKNRDDNLLRLQEMLLTQTYKTMSSQFMNPKNDKSLDFHISRIGSRITQS